MTDTVLRGCTVKDLETVCEIERQCFSVPWSKESFVSVLASPDSDLLLLTSAQDSIYGFGCVISVAGEAEILNIAVSPAHRRNGYGSGEKGKAKLPGKALCAFSCLWQRNAEIPP